MGSFNVTCFASQQTIATGDPCYVLPIRAQRGYRPVSLTGPAGDTYEAYGHTSSNCYPTGFWDIAGGFIEATYDDYGQVRVAETEENATASLAFIRLLLTRGLTTLKGENEYHDIGFDLRALMAEKMPALSALLDVNKPSKLAHEVLRAELALLDKNDAPPLTPAVLWAELHAFWGVIWDVRHNHRLFVLQSQLPTEVQFAIIHKDAYEGLIELMCQHKNWAGESLAQRPFFDRAVVKVREAVAEAKKMVAEEYAKAGRAVAATDKEANAFALMQAVSTLREELALGSDGRLLQDHGLMRELGIQLTDEAADIDAVFLQAKSALDTRYVLAGLEMLNLKLQPMAYADQDYSNEVGQRYARFIAGTSRRVSARRKARK